MIKGNKPTHLVVVPDGNRRWAKRRGLLPWDGHRRGFERFEEVGDAAYDAGIPYFTFWAASRDNLLKRSPIEVGFLISLFREMLARELSSRRLMKKKVRFRIVGEGVKISKDAELARLAERLEKETRTFKKKQLTVLFGYDGVEEMLAAFEKISRLRPKKIDYDAVKKQLWTAGLPEADYIIRTGGEPHWSAGLMMWLARNSQLYFTRTLWPDFGRTKLMLALKDYRSRQRRFGK